MSLRTWIADRILGSHKEEFLRDTNNRQPPSPDALSAGSEGWAEPSTFMNLAKVNPDDLMGRKGFSIYKRMITDEQVKAVVHFKRSTVTGRDWYFELDHEATGLSEDEAQRRIDIYTTMLEEGYSGPFSDGMKAIMKAMWQGFSFTEQIFGQFEHQGRTYWGIRELKSKPFDTFRPYVDEMGQVTKWAQTGGPRHREREIDLSKFVYFRYNPDMDEHYGWSDLRAAYRAYVSKDITIRFMNIFMERLAGGFPVATPQEGVTLDRNSKEWNDLTAILSNITGKSSVLMPSGIDLEVHTVSGAQFDVFGKAVELHDLSIAKAMLMPNLLGMSHSGQTGAFSQSDTQFDVFIIVSDDESERLADALNEQVFSPLGRVNFADGIAPKFRLRPLSRRKRQQVLNTWKEMVTSKAVEPSETDERHIRDMLDFPEKGEPIKSEPPAGQQPPPPPPGSEDQGGRGEEDQTPVGQGQEAERTRAARAAFARAERRVAFAVIDRQTQSRVDEHVPRIEFVVAEVISAAVASIEEQGLGSDPATADKIGRFDLDGFKVRRINTQVGRALNTGMRIGQDHAMRELEKARGERMSRRIDFDRLGDMASEYLKSKSFTIAGDVKTGVVKIIKNTLLNGLKFSWTQREIQRNIYKELVTNGYLAGQSAAEALGMDDLRALAEELDIQGDLSPHRLNTVIRTNMFEAVNEARFNSFTDPSLEGFVRALEYSSVLDSRTTRVCNHMNGRVYTTSDSEVWDRWRPPNHFNCRSILIPVTEIDEDVELTDSRPSVLPQDGFGG